VALLRRKSGGRKARKIGRNFSKWLQSCAKTDPQRQTTHSPTYSPASTRSAEPQLQACRREFVSPLVCFSSRLFFVRSSVSLFLCFSASLRPSVSLPSRSACGRLFVCPAAQLSSGRQTNGHPARTVQRQDSGRDSGRDVESTARTQFPERQRVSSLSQSGFSRSGFSQSLFSRATSTKINFQSSLGEGTTSRTKRRPFEVAISKGRKWPSGVASIMGSLSETGRARDCVWSLVGVRVGLQLSFDCAQCLTAALHWPSVGLSPRP